MASQWFTARIQRSHSLGQGGFQASCFGFVGKLIRTEAFKPLLNLSETCTCNLWRENFRGDKDKLVPKNLSLLL